MVRQQGVAPRRAAAYIRVSTDDQTELSPESQLEEIRRYAQEAGIRLLEEHIYIDPGISGKRAEKRPAFMRMIAAAKAKKEWMARYIGNHPGESGMVYCSTRRQTEDVAAMCQAYEKQIEEWGGVDLQLLGIGHDGHIGFNEPTDHFPAMTHEVELEEITRQANKRFFNSIDEVPTAAYTMGIGTVMAARKVVLVATGADKKEILYKTLCGPVTPQVPASILQFHPDVTIICDEAAYPL